MAPACGPTFVRMNPKAAEGALVPPDTFHRIAEAIAYLRAHFQAQPTLEELARQAHLSPYHFQRLFSDWAGVSPKKFLQYLSLDHAKRLLQGQATLADAALETGLSGTGRLHDLFVRIEAMTPGEYKAGGRSLHIRYGFGDSPFGRLLLASTPRGICHLSFADDEGQALEALRAAFPRAAWRREDDGHQQEALAFFRQDWSRLSEIRLHLRGTPFQLKVWETLLRIPPGGLDTYGRLAQRLGTPRAARAVGSAVGDNPVAFLIPCHRVIRADGSFGEYRWGSARKAAMIGWEAARHQG